MSKLTEFGPFGERVSHELSKCDEKRGEKKREWLSKAVFLAEELTCVDRSPSSLALTV